MTLTCPRSKVPIRISQIHLGAHILFFPTTVTCFWQVYREVYIFSVFHKYRSFLFSVATQQGPWLVTWKIGTSLRLMPNSHVATTYVAGVPIYVSRVSLPVSPTFRLFSINDQTFWSYRPFRDKCTEWQQNYLEHYKVRATLLARWVVQGNKLAENAFTCPL